MPELTSRQLEALTAVSDGRIQWGHTHPNIARRNQSGVLAFLIDGHSVDGGQHATYARLAEKGWIVERIDLLPTKTVPAHTRRSRTLTGETTVTVPEHSAPADDGWRARVELTDAGRTVLEQARTKGRRDG